MKTEIDRPPPQNKDAEQAVLGAMIIDNAIIPEVLAVLQESDFYATSNRRIFGVVSGMHKLGDTAIDQVTICEVLMQADKLDEIGGAVIVAELASEVVTSINWRAYAEIVKKCAKQRRLENLGRQIAENPNPESIADYSDALNGIALDRASLDFEPLDATSGDKWVQPWAIYQWLPLGEVTIFTGDGGVGKSRLLLQIAGKLATGWPGNAWEDSSSRITKEDGMRVIFASYEEHKRQLVNRALDVRSAFSWFDLECVRDRVQVVQMKGKGPIWGVPKQTSYQRSELLPLGFQLLEKAKKDGANLLVIDPLGLAFGGDENKRAEVSEFMSCLSLWAQETGGAVLVSAHPPKGDGSDYSGSTAWLGSCRCMWTLKNKDKEDTGTFTFKVIKSNCGLKPDPVTIQQNKYGVWTAQDNLKTEAKTNGKPTAKLDTHGI